MLTPLLSLFYHGEGVGIVEYSRLGTINEEIAIKQALSKVRPENTAAGNKN